MVTNKTVKLQYQLSGGTTLDILSSTFDDDYGASSPSATFATSSDYGFIELIRSLLREPVQHVLGTASLSTTMGDLSTAFGNGGVFSELETFTGSNGLFATLNTDYTSGLFSYLSSLLFLSTGNQSSSTDIYSFWNNEYTTDPSDSDATKIYNPFLYVIKALFTTGFSSGYGSSGTATLYDYIQGFVNFDAMAKSLSDAKSNFSLSVST